MRSAGLAVVLWVVSAAVAGAQANTESCAELKKEQERAETAQQVDYRLLNEIVQRRAKECPAPSTFLEAAIALIRINETLDPSDPEGAPAKVAARRKQAMDYLQEALRRKDPPLSETEAALAEGHVKRLAESLVVVQLVPSDIGSRATIEVDARQVKVAGDRFWVTPGRHTFVFKPQESGREAVVHEMPDLSAGATHVVSVRFPFATSTLAGYRVVIQPAVEATLEVDGESVRRDGDGMLWLAPGQHTLAVSADGYRTHEETLDAAAGQTEVKTVQLVRADGSGGGFPVGPVVVASVGAAMLIAGAVTGGLAAGKESELADECPNKVCDPELQGTKDSAETLATATDALLIGGGAVLVGGILWWVLTPGEPESAGARVDPILTPFHAGVRVHGAF